MNLRDSVKRLLRMCGDAAGGLANERLAEVLEQNAQLARTQNTLLEANIHFVESLREARQALAELRTHQAAVITLIENVAVHRVSVETDDHEAANPETGLLAFLYSYLPSRIALDVGAHTGDVSDRLLQAGYEVYAFEPAPRVFEQLQQRLGGRPAFRAFPFALGSSEGEAFLHVVTEQSKEHYYDDPSLLSTLTERPMPGDLTFGEKIPVAVKTINDLHRAGMIPDDIGLVKIDTEGFDLEVIRGMGEHRYPVVCAEYFDTSHPFGHDPLFTLETLVEEMRNRGYLWHIVIHQDFHCKYITYYCNHPRPVPGAWGNVFFFRQRNVFAEAQAWCSATIPRTYFKATRSQ